MGHRWNGRLILFMAETSTEWSHVYGRKQKTLGLPRKTMPTACLQMNECKSGKSSVCDSDGNK